MRKKSTKLAKLERNRYSIFTNDYIHCYYCHNFKSKLDIHEVYGGSNRQRSMKYGLCVPLCRACHSNEVVIQDLRKWCQREYEKTHSRMEFIQIIRKKLFIGGKICKI